MRIQVIAGAVCLLFAVFTARPVSAQVETDSVHHRNACRLATQVLLHGRPANKRPWALTYFPSCGAQGVNVVRDLLDRHRRDNTQTRELDEIVTAALGLIDRDLAFAALGVASDQSAGTAARIQALRLLYGQVEPGTAVTYARLARERESAVVADSAGNFVVPVEPLDSDWVTDVPSLTVQALTLADFEHLARSLTVLASTSTTPIQVRHAAEDVSGAYRAYLSCPTGTGYNVCLARFRQNPAGLP